MEINEKKLVQILKEQRMEFQQYVDGKFKIVDKRFEQADKRLEQVDRRLDQADKKLELDDGKFQRYLGVVAEDFASKFKLLAESISGVQEQLIVLRDMVAKNTEDITDLRLQMADLRRMVAQNTKDIRVIKEDVKIIKGDLKRTVDRDEFISLEKRVLLLEKKLARV